MKNTPVIPFEVSEALSQLGLLVSQARLARGDTLQQAADRIGVHRSTVAKVERGDVAVGVGVVFSVLNCYGMAERLFELSRPDAETTLLAMRRLPKRAVRKVAAKDRTAK